MTTVDSGQTLDISAGQTSSGTNHHLLGHCQRPLGRRDHRHGRRRPRPGEHLLGRRGERHDRVSRRHRGRAQRRHGDRHARLQQRLRAGVQRRHGERHDRVGQRHRSSCSAAARRAARSCPAGGYAGSLRRGGRGRHGRVERRLPEGVPPRHGERHDRVGRRHRIRCLRKYGGRSIVAAGGTEIVESSGTASGTVVFGGGVESCTSGVASGTTVSNGGPQIVRARGSARSYPVAAARSCVSQARPARRRSAAAARWTCLARPC